MTLAPVTTADLPELDPRRAAARSCRVCGNQRLLGYLNLGKQPYANALQRDGDELAPTAPLRLYACKRCKLSQLGFVAPRETLYESYAYRSGVSEGWRQHCASLATTYAKRDDTHIDIASNDGTLVRAMETAGMTSIGVEPSLSFGDCEYPRITAWWGTETVQRNKMEALASVITAQNVLGHVSDVHDFAAGIALALAPGGVAIIEVPYVVNMLRSLSFDTVYHEHLSYWSVTALRELCNAHGLVLCDIQKLSVHGGSIRAVIRRAADITNSDIRGSVARFLTLEQRDLHDLAYMRFSERCTARMADLNDTLRSIAPYIGFGAAAKTTVLLHCLDVRAYPAVVYDDNLYKHGFNIPGTRVSIKQQNYWREETRPVCIFAWNWADTIIPQLRAAGYRGDIYVPGLTPRWDTVKP